MIDVPRAEFLRWVNDPELELSEVVDGGGSGPQPVATDIIIGDWDPAHDRTGDRRRVRFADGHYLAEEVLADNPSTFRYMIWGFTEPRQRHSIDHAVAAFTYSDDGAGTRVTWTYSFQLLVPPLRPVVAHIVAGTMPSLMRATLAGMKQGAETA